LKNGNVIWQRDLNREYGWNDVFYTNDSTMIVVAAGLHAINIKTGRAGIIIQLQVKRIILEQLLQMRLELLRVYSQEHL